jgi:hypothetical protein
MTALEIQLCYKSLELSEGFERALSLTTLRRKITLITEASRSLALRSTKILAVRVSDGVNEN